LMCARLGMVTGRGLGGVIRKRYPPWVLWAACLLLIVANVFNIAADLGGMGDAMPHGHWNPVLVVDAVFHGPHNGTLLSGFRIPWIVRVFKWLTLVLFRVRHHRVPWLTRNWSGVLRATFVPHVEWTRGIYVRAGGNSRETSHPTCFSGRPRRKWNWRGISASDCCQAARCHGRRALHRNHRCGARDVLFESGDVLILLTTAATRMRTE